MKNILLIEPDYKNKYPPLGLMKIASYHKQKEDNVVFFKGCSPDLQNQLWDRVYISTLFTFYWDKTIKTINYYLKSVSDTQNIFVGGVMASLMKDEIYHETKATVVEGLLNEQGKLGYDDDNIIDDILPDYSIIDIKTNPKLEYQYPVFDSYISYATRGCIRHCEFCAVPIIEPIFTNGKSIAKQINAIKETYGEKRNLLMLDNNILASDALPKIIEEIKLLGFAKGAKYSSVINGKKIQLQRYVDFNQGIDARKITEDNMKLLSEIAIKPLRIAFDDIKYKNIYIEKVRLAAKYEINVLSNYILFNFKDTPEDFYQRLKINIELNEEFDREGFMARIWSFPMKYCPIRGKFSKNRKYVGVNWNKKYLRGIQCILLATHGVVGPKKEFFEEAFGRDEQEFLEILKLPENFIIYRHLHVSNGDRARLEANINSLTDKQKSDLNRMILDNAFNHLESKTNDPSLTDILKLYST
jgi:hypothetical protein